MKNKIFNAIQKGLSNALIFDDEKTSISYQKSNINNEMQYLISLDELYDLFKKDPKSIFKPFNTKNSVSLILSNRQEISLHEYKNSGAPVFLKITNEILKKDNNDIIIACDNNHYISNNKLKWQTRYNRILPINFLMYNKQAAFKDFNGYETCLSIIDIIENNSDLGKVPAIKYCNNIKSPLPFYKGYLPSIGQLNFILKYLDMINYIFEYMEFDILNLTSGLYWSSTEHDSGNAWFLDNGNTYYASKVGGVFNVLPIFALEK